MSASRSGASADEPARHVGASYTLARVREGKAYEIVRVATIPQDPLTGVIEYRIETAELEEGRYELILATCLGPVTYRTEILITPASEG